MTEGFKANTRTDLVCILEVILFCVGCTVPLLVWDTVAVAGWREGVPIATA